MAKLTLNRLLSRVQSSHKPEDTSSFSVEEEITQKTFKQGGGSHQEKGLFSAASLLEILRTLEPIFFQDIFLKLRHQALLYVAPPEAPYLDILMRRELEQVVCTGPEFAPRVLDRAGSSCEFVLTPYEETCFRKGCVELLLLPETSCKAISVMTRLHYWAGLLKSGAEMVVSLPHPQLRFLYAAKEDRRRSSRTATFERIFNHLSEVKLEVVKIRELTSSHIPEAALVAHPRWQTLKQEYEEWPLLLGLQLRKGS